METVYDNASNVIRKITPNLRAKAGYIDYDYDYNRLVAIKYPEYPENNVTYTYGPPSDRGKPGNLAGRIKKVEHAAGSEERFYDKLGQMVKEVDHIKTGAAGPKTTLNYTTEYEYDSWGRLQWLKYP
ncbi:MAG: hypothetical protein ACLFP1_03315, partial [Candidatus Goldiibacteriota bacterium]